MLLVRGGTLVNADGSSRADVLVDGETIAAIGPDQDVPAGTQVADAGGALVIPGGVDAHTHFGLRVGEVLAADDFESGTLAAACGGTTCVIDFAGAGRETPEEALDRWHEMSRGRAAIDHGFHLTVTRVPKHPEAAAARFRWFVTRGVTSVKLYLAYPERLMVDDDTLRRAFVAARATGIRVCVHAEDGLEAVRRTEEVLAAGRTGPEGLPEARPPRIEADAIASAARLAREAGASVYVVHLSSASGLEAVRAARAEGAEVLTETCPQYLFLTDARLTSGAEDAQDLVCTPPVRADADREALWAGLAGDIQAVSTDHRPFTRADRRHGTAHGPSWRDFTQIPGGLPGVETRVALAYQGVLEDRFPPERWVDLVSTTPARLFGLAHRKGKISTGMDADLVIFDPEARRHLDAASLHMRTDHSPYADLTVRGWPALTLARGRIVARDGEPADVEPGRGRYLRRNAIA